MKRDDEQPDPDMARAQAEHQAEKAADWAGDES